MTTGVFCRPGCSSRRPRRKNVEFFDTGAEAKRAGYRACTRCKPDTPSLPRLANSFELEGMYSHLRDVLMKIGFINPQNPEHWMMNIRRFLSRLPLRAREVKIIRGGCRQIDLYTKQVEKRAKGKD